MVLVREYLNDVGGDCQYTKFAKAFAFCYGPRPWGNFGFGSEKKTRLGKKENRVEGEGLGNSKVRSLL